MQEREVVMITHVEITPTPLNPREQRRPIVVDDCFFHPIKQMVHVNVMKRFILIMAGLAYAAADITPCMQARLDAPPRIGVYVPQCLDDGGWNPLQCWGSVGTCWCVDENGARTEDPVEACRNAVTST